MKLVFVDVLVFKKFVLMDSLAIAELVLMDVLVFKLVLVGCLFFQEFSRNFIGVPPENL